MASFATMILSVIPLTCILYWLINYIKLKRKADKVPGPRSYPIIGNALELRNDSDDFWDQLTGVCLRFDFCPNVMRFWLLWVPFVLIYGADEAEVVLSSNKHINKSQEYVLLQPWMGLGLLTSNAEKWRSRRKLLTPTFHYDILKDFIDVFNQQSRVLLKKLQTVAGKGEFDVYQSITLCTLDIICQSAMGKHVNAQKNEESDYVKAVYKLNFIIQDRQKKPWFWIKPLFNMFGNGKEHDRCLNIIHSFSRKVIDERFQDRRSKNKNSETESKKRLAFLDLLLEMVDRETLSLQDVREEVDTFMFEGHDTTSAGINWTLQLLGSHPEYQAKVHQELDQIFGNDDRDIKFDDLKNLNYLEMCIKEALRLFPSVPIFGRTLYEDCDIRGVCVPATTQLLFVPFVVHRDPKHWPDPEIFDPDRFLPENSVGRHPFAYLPFSAGARNCIGQRFALMEEKTILAWIFRYFKVKSCRRRDQIRLKAELTLRPSDGLRFEFTLRRRPLQD